MANVVRIDTAVLLDLTTGESMLACPQLLDKSIPIPAEMDLTPLRQAVAQQLLGNGKKTPPALEPVKK